MIIYYLKNVAKVKQSVPESISYVRDYANWGSWLSAGNTVPALKGISGSLCLSGLGILFQA